MIRRAVEHDMRELIAIGEKFTAAAGLEFDANATAESLRNLIANPQGVVFISEDGAGCIGGMMFRQFWNRLYVAQEFFWWAEHDGLALLDAFEAWADERGANQLYMACLEALTPDRVANIYKRRGYVPQERGFVRDL